MMLKLGITINTAQLAVFANGSWHVVQKWILGGTYIFASASIWQLNYTDVDMFIEELDAIAVRM